MKVWEALVQSRFRRRSGRPWCRARSCSTGFRRRFRRRFQDVLVQRVPDKVSEKVPGKVLGICGAGPSQVHWVQEKVPEKVAEKVAEKFVFLLFVFMHGHTGDL